MIRLLLQNHDAEALAEIARAITDVDVPPEEFLNHCLEAKEEIERRQNSELGVSCASTWPEQTWHCWIRNRASKYRILPDKKTETVFVSAILHVGFCCIEETEEQLERLKSPDGEIKESSVARSKISKTNQIIEPVDRVAARVT